MPAIYTNFDDDDHSAFAEFIKAEGLKPSPGLVRIFREWRRLIAGKTIERFSTLSPDQLSLILGEAAEIKRGLKRCELALMEPQPLSPEDITARQALRAEVRSHLGRIDQWQDGLIRTQMVIAIPPPDLAIASALARFSYKWFGPNTDKYREIVWAFLKLFIPIPPAPAATPKVPAAAAGSSQTPPQ